MSYLSADQIQGILTNLASEYDQLLENRTKLQNDCTKLREFIDSQIQQIQNLNSDFEKLRAEYMQHQEEFAAQEIHAAQRQQPAPETEKPQSPMEEDQQDWKATPLPGSEKCPVYISLVAEIVDFSIICATAYSPDGTCLAIGSNAMRIYNTENDKFILQFQIEGDSSQPNFIRSIAWTPHGNQLICGGEDRKLRVFELTEGQEENATPIRTIDSEASIFQIKFISDGKYFVTAAGDGSLCLWDALTYSKLWTHKRIVENVVAASLAVSTDNKLVAVGYDDKNVCIFDIDQRKLLLTSECHAAGVYAIVFIPNTHRLITSSLDASIKIWDIVETGGNYEMKLLNTIKQHTDYVLAVAVDPTGKWLLSGSKDMTMKLINLEMGQALYSIKSHSNSIISCDFNPTSLAFCSGSGDKTVKIWNISPPDAVE
ncbi:Transcriptional repressor tup11-related protein [Trichomonas vaginalis G3]|uniref:Transcriptional repressor tup11-related protein n=1 Tax=Trichomonas vaginalis (strain ATCC PRA-98 / G3) TaxID=412133 RepID=A2ECA7_TRIV3|nr:WD repeat-containing protein family [Trichomonas vaginalis G3]EAY09691.1 Transcriptional repressor tup11-related protein [Trichomonas vaginalis G3]KAI5533955.1 WD repeat-containing protein family [Trichomonas vaginalis G3]|eukprot:XP_001321914.1 Transcriptional repressor tup11-related protein [Trichomonas vaginalis G3]